MSRNDWEAGTLRLPTVEFARVRKAVEEAERKRLQAVFDHSQTFWKGLTRKQQTGPHAYFEALRAYADRLDRLSLGRHGLAADDFVTELARPVGNPYVDQTFGKPRRILKTDLPFPTNRTTEFWHGEVSITFDRNNSTVTYDSGENNRQVETGRNTPMVRALLAALDTVRWTRGTGGVFCGNDEYNEEDGYDRGSYATLAFGPAGALEAPANCRPYTTSKGERVSESDLLEARRRQMQERMDFARRTGMSVTL